MKNIIFISLAWLLSVSVYSSENTTAAVPKNLHIYSTSGNAYVTLPSKGCSTKGVYSLSGSHPKFDAIFSMLLAAQVGGKEVVARFESCVFGVGVGVVVVVILS